jgi:predicted PurR-regulated permease PerM
MMLAHTEFRTRLQTICIVLVAMVVVVTAMKLAKCLLAPVTLGLIVGIVAAPGMRLLARLGIPRAVSASISLLFVGAATVLLIAGLGPIVMDLIGQVPRIEDEIRWWVIDASRAIRGLESVQIELEQSLAEDGKEVEAAMPSLLDALSMAPNFAAQLLTFAGTFFFFTLTQNEIYATVKGKAASLRQADKAVSHYFVTVAAINAGLGAAVFAAMTVIGVPNPILWGAAAFILNFVLYLGPVMLLVALAVVGFTEFNGAYALLEPWLRDREQVDTTRRMMPFIGAWPQGLISDLANNDYNSLADLMRMAAAHIQSRNLSLDLLPLFKHAEPDLFAECYDIDDKTAARPTFHFRLPDSRIDEADWSLRQPWQLWRQVELVAANDTLLTALRDAWKTHDAAWFERKSVWVKTIDTLLQDHDAKADL